MSKTPTHVFPEDDFEHEETMSCPCRPFVQFAWLGAVICHNRLQIGEVFPQEWA